jgi:hypothetical protein
MGMSGPKSRLRTKWARKSVRVEWRCSSLIPKWSASRTCRYTPAETVTGAHCVADWVGFIVSLEVMEERNFLTPARKQTPTLYVPVRSHYTYWAILSVVVRINSRGKWGFWYSCVSRFMCVELWSFEFFAVQGSCKFNDLIRTIKRNVQFMFFALEYQRVL